MKRINPLYYETFRQDILSQPLSLQDETLFKITTQAWKIHHRDHPSEYLLEFPSKTIEAVQQEAFHHTQIPAKNNSSPLNLFLWNGWIEQLATDAIVNAANETLLGGGGVDGAIHRAAGPLLLRECATIRGGCEVGEAKITKGYHLPASYVIHTVGPILTEYGETDPRTLTECYLNSLKLCDEYGLESVAFPPISCGFYGYPVQEASEVVLKAIQNYAAARRESPLHTIIFTLPEKAQKEAYLKTFLTRQGDL